MSKHLVREAVDRLKEATRADRERMRRLAALGDPEATADVERQERRGGLAGKEQPLMRALQRAGLDNLVVAGQRITNLDEFMSLEHVSMVSATIRPGHHGAVELAISQDHAVEPYWKARVRLHIEFNRITERDPGSVSGFRFRPNQQIGSRVVSGLKKHGWKPAGRDGFSWERNVEYGSAKEVAPRIVKAIKDVMQLFASSGLHEATARRDAHLKEHPSQLYRCEKGLPCFASCPITGRHCIDLPQSKDVLVKRYKEGPQRVEGWQYKVHDLSKHGLDKTFGGYDVGRTHGMARLVRDGRQWRIEYVVYNKQGRRSTKWLPEKYKSRKAALEAALGYNWSAWNDILTGIKNWSTQAKANR